MKAHNSDKAVNKTASPKAKSPAKVKDSAYAGGKIHPFPSKEPRDENKEIAANNRGAAAGVAPGDWGEKAMH